MREIRIRVPPGPGSHLTRAVLTSLFTLLPLLVAALAVDALVVVGAIGGDRTAAAVGLAGGLIALSGAVPRTDLPHVQGLAPLALVALASTGLAVDVPAWFGVPVAAWAVVALLVSLDPARRRGPGPVEVDLDLPHLRGLPVPRKAPGSRPADGGELRAMTGGRVFLLRPDAALWYLAADLRNPTPYDYPYASVFGPDGQRETIAAIEAGAVEWVCWPEPMAGRLAPLELQAFVATAMAPVADTPAGRLYRLP